MLGFGLGLNKWRRVGGGYVGLLDLFPNAAAAYSLRLLRKDYSGGLVRARAWDGSANQGEADVMAYRVSATEYVLDLNSTLENLDATAISRGLTTSDTLADLVSTGVNDYDGLTSAWYDQSLSNDATQGTAAAQPKIVSGGSLVTEGSKPAVDFDGTDDYLAKIATFTINGDHMITAVHTPEALGGYLFSFGYNDPDSVLLWTNATNYSRYWVNSSGDTLNSGETVAGQRLTTGEMSSGAQTLYINAAQNSTKSTTYNGGNVPDITIGYAVQRAQGTNYLPGKVQELIFYNSDQSSNRAGIETNINTFYSIYP